MEGEGRVAFVSAGSAGIGRGVASVLATAGYRMAVSFRAGGTSPDRTLDAIREAGAEGFAVEADFARPGEAARTVREVQAHFGRLDVLVHAVGPMLIRRFERTTRDDYEHMLETNLGSAVEISAAALPTMRERRFGRIIFFGMNGSHAAAPARGLALYAAAKAGLVAFARTLALEEGRYGITVNVVEPGDIRDKDSPRALAATVAAKNPTGRAGSSEDVADAVRFLVSERAGFINGAVLGVNGGLVEPHE